MLYLLSIALSILVVASESEAERRLSMPAVEDLVMERDFLDGIAYRAALGAFNGIEEFFHMRRRIEDDSDRLNFVVEKVDRAPQRRLVCAGLCIALAAAVAGGVAGGATQGLIGLAGSVEAPNLDLTAAQIDQIAMTAAQGAYDAVENQFGIKGIEAFGDSLASAMSLHRRPLCAGLCIAIGTAIAGGIASGVAGGLIGLAGNIFNSVEADSLNIDTSIITEPMVEQVASIESATMDLIAQIATGGALDALHCIIPSLCNPLLAGR